METMETEKYNITVNGDVIIFTSKTGKFVDRFEIACEADFQNIYRMGHFRKLLTRAEVEQLFDLWLCF